MAKAKMQREEHHFDPVGWLGKHVAYYGLLCNPIAQVVKSYMGIIIIGESILI